MPGWGWFLLGGLTVGLIVFVYVIKLASDMFGGW